jgi:hypothetical protein
MAERRSVNSLHLIESIENIPASERELVITSPSYFYIIPVATAHPNLISLFTIQKRGGFHE